MFQGTRKSLGLTFRGWREQNQNADLGFECFAPIILSAPTVRYSLLGFSLGRSLGRPSSPVVEKRVKQPKSWKPPRKEVAHVRHG